ncbi:hypothetical protein FQN55_000139 [Onygenales sp. PD_40]|nr:hypothetical protein FQN55_000139 [Onygenales sp. PD_40]KAK2790852.1 hypothetical protein FQN53_008676 [Emmonsiellopsis sp. PD_33]
MSSIAATFARRAALRQSLRPALRPQPTTLRSIRHSSSAQSKVQEAGLDKAPRKDPELYILLGIMAGAFGLVGWYFGSSPTSTTSESNVRVAKGAMPWNAEEEGKTTYKYQYHPYGDTSKPLKNAPSALNEVIIPDVTLPKDLHDRFNKYGKDDY